MSISVVFAIAGVVALLIGVLGGGIKAKEVEIPHLPPSIRVIASVVGLVLIGVALQLSSPNPPDDPPPPTEVAIATQTPVVTEVIPQFTAIPDNDDSIVYEEDFASGTARYWQVGDKDNDDRTASRIVVDNALRWTVTAKQGVLTSIDSIGLPLVPDFVLDVTLEQTEGSDSIEHGIQFRKTEAGFYRFMINSTLSISSGVTHRIDQTIENRGWN